MLRGECNSLLVLVYSMNLRLNRPWHVGCALFNESRIIEEGFTMNFKKELVTAALIATGLGLGTPGAFAQNAPGGSPRPSQPGGPTGPTFPQPDLGVPNPGPVVPQPGPHLPPTDPSIPQSGRQLPQPNPGAPRQTEPTIPGQPAPGLPQQQPFPGRPETIPERSQAPNMESQKMVVTPKSHQPSPTSAECQRFRARRERPT